MMRMTLTVALCAVSLAFAADVQAVSVAAKATAVAADTTQMYPVPKDTRSALSQLTKTEEPQPKKTWSKIKDLFL